MTPLDSAILRDAIDTFGTDAQWGKLQEELLELCVELARKKAGRPHDIYEEIADVEIMLAQARMMLGDNSCIDAWKVEKLQRLKRRIDDTKPPRGTPENPCEYCGQAEKGSTRDYKGFMRCNRCGEPGP